MTILFFLFFCATTLFAQNIEEPFKPKNIQQPKRLCTETAAWLKYAENDTNLVEISNLEGIQIALAYATFENISGHDLYCGSKRAFIRQDAYKKLLKAIKILQKEMPHAQFIIFDAARPLYAQRALKSAVVNTPYSHFVSSGKTGGLHNYGLALDLSILDSAGTPLDMGTPFDSFERAAGKIGEEAALKKGRLSQKQIENREKLRSIMKRAGFVPLDTEWWHFNAFTRAYTKEHYPLFPL